MFGQVLKLLIKTRFTPYYFMGLFFVFLYSTFAQLSQGSQARNIGGILYVSLILGVFGTISILLGGLMSTKSDSEFLFVSPIRKRDLAPALYLAQFLTTGPLILAGSSYYVIAFGKGGSIEALGFINLILLALLTVSLGISLSVLKSYQRILVAVAYDLWVVSPILGFGLGATSFLSSNPFPGTAVIIAVTSIALGGAFVALSGEHLPIRVSALKSGSRDFKKLTKYLGLTPFRSVIRFGLTQVSIAARSASVGSVRVSARRIRLIYFLIAMIGAAVFYVFVTVSFPQAVGGFNTTVFLFAFYFGIFPQIMISSGAIAMERAWLAFMSMEPWRYMRFLILSKMAQVLVISIPMAAGSMIAWFLGVSSGIDAAITYLSLPPAIVCVYLYIAFSSRPYQVRDEEYLAARFGGSQYLVVVPIFLYSMAVVFMLFAPISIPVVLALFYASVAYILSRHRYWNIRLNKVFESGFV